MAKKKSPSKPKYSVTIKLGSTTLKGSGATALEALASVERPTKIVSKTFFSITDGIRKREMMLQPIRAKRLFYPIAQTILAKQLERTMK